MNNLSYSPIITKREPLDPARCIYTVIHITEYTDNKESEMSLIGIYKYEKDAILSAKGFIRPYHKKEVKRCVNDVYMCKILEKYEKNLPSHLYIGSYNAFRPLNTGNINTNPQIKPSSIQSNYPSSF